MTGFRCAAKNSYNIMAHKKQSVIGATHPGAYAEGVPVHKGGEDVNFSGLRDAKCNSFTTSMQVRCSIPS